MPGCTLDTAQNSSGPQAPPSVGHCLPYSHRKAQSSRAGPPISRLREARPEGPVWIRPRVPVCSGLGESEPPQTGSPPLTEQESR